MKTPVYLLAVLLAVPVLSARAAAQSEPKPKEYRLAGTVGDLPVRMRLQVEGRDVSGDYVYETPRPARHSVVDAISVAGKLDAQGKLELAETTTDAKGNEVGSGVFRGVLASSDAGVTIAGTWSKPDGSRALTFSLAERRAAAAGLRTATKQYAVGDAALAKIVEASYPVFSGGNEAKTAALNAEVERWMATTVKDFAGDVADDIKAPERAEQLALDVDYEITAASPDLVSIVFDIYTDFGGAHPSSYEHTINYDLRRGRELALADLFVDKATYLKALAAKCAPLFAHGDDLAADTSPSLENYHTWYLTPNGLTIVFEVPHVTGDTAEAYIPYGSLRGLVDPAGPAGAFVK